MPFPTLLPNARNDDVFCFFLFWGGVWGERVGVAKGSRTRRRLGRAAVVLRSNFAVRLPVILWWTRQDIGAWGKKQRDLSRVRPRAMF